MSRICCSSFVLYLCGYPQYTWRRSPSRTDSMPWHVLSCHVYIHVMSSVLQDQRDSTSRQWGFFFFCICNWPDFLLFISSESAYRSVVCYSDPSCLPFCLSFFLSLHLSLSVSICLFFRRSVFCAAMTILHPRELALVQDPFFKALRLAELGIKIRSYIWFGLFFFSFFSLFYIDKSKYRGVKEPGPHRRCCYFSVNSSWPSLSTAHIRDINSDTQTQPSRILHTSLTLLANITELESL